MRKIIERQISERSRWNANHDPVASFLKKLLAAAILCLIVAWLLK